MHGTIDDLLHAEWRPLDALADVVPAWEDLAGRAAEANVFYESAFALAAAPVFGRNVGAVLVWSRARLVGFFPLRRGRAVLTGWTHPFAPLGTPLVDAAICDAVVATFLDHLRQNPALPKSMLIPHLATDGPVATAFARHAHRLRDFAPHARAMLQPAGDRSQYLAQALGPRSRKELPRKRRRLAELGAVAHTRAPDAAAAMDAFLRLEASGWKGRAGTAMAQRADISRFAQNAVAALARDGKARIDLLTLDERPLAAMITLRSGATAFSWKIAYDETFARYSPGVQLVHDVSAALLADPAIARIDSCAAARHPMIDRIWRERLALADRLIAVSPGIAFDVVSVVERMRRGAMETVKSLLR